MRCRKRVVERGSAEEGIQPKSRLEKDFESAFSALHFGVCGVTERPSFIQNIVLEKMGDVV